jgi:hypothetical protein
VVKALGCIAQRSMHILNFQVRQIFYDLLSAQARSKQIKNINECACREYMAGLHTAQRLW